MKTLLSGLPEQVGDDEDLARFVTSKKHIKATKVKPSAFLPNPSDNATSVYRHGGEPRSELWKIGDDNLKVHRIYGAAFIKAGPLREALLDVVGEEPPLRHANIVGWPSDDDPEMKKAREKELTLLIARQEELIIRPQTAT